jgi:DNA-binding transcriptional MerR regulator
VSEKSEGAFRTIGEVAEGLDLPQHVLRFWETRFKEIEPIKRAGGRRYYRPRDVELLSAIRQLLYGQGYTIKGVQRILREQGARAVIEGARTGRLERSAPKSSDGRADAVEPAEGDALEAKAAATARDRDVGQASTAPSLAAQTNSAVPTQEPTAAHIDQRGLDFPVDADAKKRLRQALAELSECQRLLTLTRR